MINCWTVSDRDDKPCRVPAVRSFRLVGTGLRVEDAAGMYGGSHCHHYFAIRDLNFATDTHDRVSLSLLAGEASELYQVAGQLRIADEYRPGLICDFNCVANVVAMSMCQQNVINSSKFQQRIFVVSGCGVGRIP